MADGTRDRGKDKLSANPRPLPPMHTMKKPTTNPKPKRNRITVTLHILRSRHDVFAMASEEIERSRLAALAYEARLSRSTMS